jgi:hypothetical protein
MCCDFSMPLTQKCSFRVHLLGVNAFTLNTLRDFFANDVQSCGFSSETTHLLPIGLVSLHLAFKDDFCLSTQLLGVLTSCLVEVSSDHVINRQ